MVCGFLQWRNCREASLKARPLQTDGRGAMVYDWLAASREEKLRTTQKQMVTGSTGRDNRPKSMGEEHSGEYIKNMQRYNESLRNTSFANERNDGISFELLLPTLWVVNKPLTHYPKHYYLHCQWKHTCVKTLRLILLSEMIRQGHSKLNWANSYKKSNEIIAGNGVDFYLDSREHFKDQAER